MIKDAIPDPLTDPLGAYLHAELTRQFKSIFPNPVALRVPTTSTHAQKAGDDVFPMPPGVVARRHCVE